MMDTRKVKLSAEALQELERIHVEKTANGIGSVLFCLGLAVAVVGGLLGSGDAALAGSLAFGFSAFIAALYPSMRLSA